MVHTGSHPAHHVRRALLGPLAALFVLGAAAFAVDRYLASTRAVDATRDSCVAPDGAPCQEQQPELERLTLRGLTGARPEGRG